MLFMICFFQAKFHLAWKKQIMKSMNAFKPYCYITLFTLHV